MILWAVLLIIQNFTFTMVSRARTSNSIGYHAFAATLSNGVWFLSQFILIDKVTSLLKSNAGWDVMLRIGAVYTLATMTGSLASHWLALRYEKRVIGER